MVIAYVCQNGFKIIRGGSVVCSQSGIWVGGFIVCQGNFNLVSQVNSKFESMGLLLAYEMSSPKKQCFTR